MSRYDDCEDWAEDKIQKYVEEIEGANGPLSEFDIDPLVLLVGLMRKMGIDEIFFGMILGNKNYEHLVKKGICRDDG